MKYLLILGAAITFVLSTVAFANETQQVAGLYPLVCIPTTASEQHLAAARRLAKHFSLIPEPNRSISNPVCCVWLEITNWLPNPGQSGYIINHQPGGTVIMASSIQELERAVDALIRSATSVDGKPVAPIGIQTNYPIVPTTK